MCVLKMLRAKESSSQHMSNESTAEGSRDTSHSHVTAIICTSNRYDLLASLLESLIPEFRNNQGDVILVVDNSPADKFQSSFQHKYELHPFLKFLRSDLEGLSRARNAGLVAAETDLVAYLDDDTIAWPGWLEAIKCAFESDANVACVAGRVNLRWLGGRPDWIDPRLMGYFGHLDFGPEPRLLGSDEFPVGCNMAFRRDVLLALGGFLLILGRTANADILLSNEDIEIAMRIRSANMSVIYWPRATVDHCVDSSRADEAWLIKRIDGQAISDIVVGRARKWKLLFRAIWRRPALELALAYYRFASHSREPSSSANITYLKLEERYDTMLIKYFVKIRS